MEASNQIRVRVAFNQIMVRVASNRISLMEVFIQIDLEIEISHPEEDTFLVNLALEFLNILNLVDIIQEASVKEGIGHIQEAFIMEDINLMEFVKVDINQVPFVVVGIDQEAFIKEGMLMVDTNLVTILHILVVGTTTQVNLDLYYLTFYFKLIEK